MYTRRIRCKVKGDRLYCGNRTMSSLDYEDTWQKHLIENFWGKLDFVTPFAFWTEETVSNFFK